MTGQSTTVAALTAHALEEERETILAAGCDDFVRKPYREQEIFEVMGKHLGLKYVYEGMTGQTVPIEPEVEWRRGQLAAIPVELRSQLYKAVIELDTARTLTLIEQIAEQDAAMGNGLKALAQKLNYDRLLTLLESKGAKDGGTS